MDFDRYMILYSDRAGELPADLSRLAPITSLMLGHAMAAEEAPYGTTGGTSIGCYHGERFVGSINFYSGQELHPESSANSAGLVSLWLPLACFPDILAILYREKRLSLCLIRTDLDGRPLARPMGTLLTWPEATGTAP